MIPIRSLLLTLVLLIPAFSFAQDTLYLNEQWKPCKEKKASYYRVITKQPDGKYKVEDHFMNGQLQMSGTYLSANIEDKTQLDGYFINKDAKGYTTDEGTYTAGKQTGFWKFYYKNSNALKGTKDFRADSTMYTVGYDSATGKKKYEVANKGAYCPIRNVWYYAGTGTVAEERLYSGCSLVTATQYYSNGKIKRQNRFKDDSVEGNAYDADGKEIAYIAPKPVYTHADQQPEPSIDMGSYLSRELRYPVKARSNNIQGNVLLKFIVNEDGRISDIVVIKNADNDLSEEAVRVIAAMPPWKPGMVNKIPVKVYFIQPITFMLH